MKLRLNNSIFLFVSKIFYYIGNFEENFLKVDKNGNYKIHW